MKKTRFTIKVNVLLLDIQNIDPHMDWIWILDLLQNRLQLPTHRHHQHVILARVLNKRQPRLNIKINVLDIQNTVLVLKWTRF
jgi:hypothetical protein